MYFLLEHSLSIDSNARATRSPGAPPDISAEPFIPSVQFSSAQAASEIPISKISGIPSLLIKLDQEQNDHIFTRIRYARLRSSDQRSGMNEIPEERLNVSPGFLQKFYLC